MFLENTKKTGSIEVICGSMFSGKTEELIRRLRRAQFANLKVEIYKPAVDVRYSEAEVVSHDSHSIPSTPIDSPGSMLLLSGDVDVVGIDEAQFFDDTLVEVAQALADRGVRVIVAGLDTDFAGIMVLRTLDNLKAAVPPLLQQGYRQSHGMTGTISGDDVLLRHSPMPHCLCGYRFPS